MTLLFADGFDHYKGGGTDEQGEYHLKWIGTKIGYMDQSSIQNSTPRRVGGRYLHCSTTNPYVVAALPAVDTLIVGFALRTYLPPKQPPVNVTNAPVFFGSALSEFEFGVVLGEDGSLVAVRRHVTGNTVLGVTRAGVILGGNWHYVEVKGKIHDSAGIITIKVDGETELELTGVDTKYVSDTISTVHLAPPSGGSDFADVYICDTNGAVNNDFLGDVRVDTLYPTADGHYSEWDPYTGEVLTPGTHYDRVDDPHDIDETDYVETDVAGEAESYAFEDLSLLGADVFGVIVNTVAKKTDAGFRALSALARIGSTDYWEDAHYISNAYWTHQHILELNPATLAAWNESEINAAEFGFKLAV